MKRMAGTAGRVTKGLRLVAALCVLVAGMALAAPASAQQPLTARFVSVPDSHDGSSSFEIRIRFSEELKNRKLGGKVVRVTNGDNTASSRLDGDDEVWEITIEPDGNDDVTIRLAAGDDTGCVSGLACTTDFRPLSAAITANVEGPTANPTEGDSGTDTTTPTTTTTTTTTTPSAPEPPELPPELTVEEALLPGDEGYVYLGIINGYERAKFRDNELDGTADDRNWYQFVVSGSGGRLSVKADLGLRRLDADADLFLRDRDGNVVEASRNDGTADEKIRMSLSGGVYYLEVRAKQAGANAYRLRYGISSLYREIVGDESPGDTITFVPNSFLYGHGGGQNQPPDSTRLLSSLHIPNWETDGERRDKHLIVMAPGESVSQPFYSGGPINVAGLTLSFASLPAAVQPDDLDLRIVRCDPTTIWRSYWRWHEVVDCTITLDSSGNVDSDDVLVEFHAPTSILDVSSVRVLFRNDRNWTRIRSSTNTPFHVGSSGRPYFAILFTNRSSTDVTLDVVTTGYLIGSSSYSCRGGCDKDDFAMFMYAGSYNIRRGQMRLPGIDRYDADGTKMARRAKHGPDNRWGELKFALWGRN